MLLCTIYNKHEKGIVLGNVIEMDAEDVIQYMRIAVMESFDTGKKEALDFLMAVRGDPDLSPIDEAAKTIEGKQIMLNGYGLEITGTEYIYKIYIQEIEGFIPGDYNDILREQYDID